MSRKPFGLLCPTDPKHGSLYGLAQATSRGEGWYCASQEHDGWRDRPYVRPFFTTAEAEAATEAAKGTRR